MSAKHVVVFDDSEIVLDLVSACLESAGYDVSTYEAPFVEAVTGSHHPSMVLVDINMQDTYGDDVVEFLKGTCQIACPVYLYSSIAEEELTWLQEKSGADGYVSKEWGMERLVESVRGAIGDP